MRHPRLVATIIVVLLLGMWGTVAGPGWSPDPYLNQIIPDTSDTAIGSSVRTDPPRTYEVASEVHSLESDAGPINVTVRRPLGKETPSPAVVFMHGTGTYLHTAFTQHATVLASAGIVTLVGDKPLDSYSTTERDYGELASAYRDQWEWLRELDGVDENEVGVYGESEGAFIAPMVAAAEPEVAFVVLVSSPVVPIRQQGALAADTYLRQMRVPEQLLQAIPRLIGGELPGGFDYIDFDVGPYQEQITQPVLILYGTGDLSMPVIQGAQQIIDDIATNGNTDYTLRYYEGADHGLRVLERGSPSLSRVAAEDISRWILGLPATASADPQIAGAQPVQHFTAEEPGTPRWYASGAAPIIILIVGLTLTVFGFLAGLVGQIRVQKAPLLDLRGTSRPLIQAGASVVIAWAVFVWYLLAIADLALSYQTDALIVRGGWLVCQIVAIIAAGMVVRLIYSWLRARPLTGFPHVVLVSSILGLTTLLAALAYWNVYPSLLTAL
ncbi:prolyl oligopeptidase family serine peptidase [Flaviflexus huanghaiensis]|uniref:prolyl oligopeptidase family serine peptidase n=1 Tax=Flaviflexus huanghaiensis TaxID=1111473 RepID=UPI0015FE5412